ncbi:ROK family protein [Nostoc sp. 'Peltigera membranacea cyanobiont' N6]|uniref:ROK family protein n=1 Tax=Nostoc sp. 'Peltigera membranacea cyanobiont' N6 TaxID=1261031 RepID=UPI000CF303F8|nr:ROK family protein [Nostoc sp. 'Peltigera membranacea cyanobiont' N6]AVH62087.1 ROK family transcriptional regulator [Nostoc sp. 'Peltigera membranacea cyanobiont' N6]
MTLILALDFGGTKLAAGLVNIGSRKWLRYERRLSPANGNASTDLEIMRSLIYSLLEDAKPAAIGVSFGGPVDASTGTVRLSHHVAGWENIPLKELLEDEFGVSVGVDNDANIAALGEHRFGAGQGYDSLFYITVSTGVGGGWILNGQPWRGAGGMAGEIGHIVVDPAGPVCLCGKRGCVERLASGPYMARNVREILENEPQRRGELRDGKVLRDLVGDDLRLLTGQLVAEAAAAGDELAREVLHKAAWALGVGIGNVANLMNPQRFVLGGGVMKAGEDFWRVVRQVSRETALPEVDFEIVPAVLGDDAPLWGGVAIASMLV